MIFPLLFSVPSTFFTFRGLSSFVILKPCFLAISLSMNIPMALLSKSAFTVMPLCISTFSIPMSSHTFLRILNVFLTSLSFTSSFAALSGSLDYVLLCCAFASLDCAVFSFLLFSHPHWLNTFHLLNKITLYPLLSST